MASSAYEQLLAVQDLDLTLTQLRHRLAHHPVRAELEALEAEEAEVGTQRDEVGARRHDLERELARLGDEVASIEERRTRTEAKLYDGTVTATKELLALQDEGRSLLERQRRIEDDELELMESLEGVAAEADTVAGTLAGLAERRATLEAALAEATAGIEAELAAATEARAAAAEPVSAELMARYQALAPDFDGAPLARFVGGRCDGCHMQLSAVAVDRIAKQPPEAVVTCDECGRMLIR